MSPIISVVVPTRDRPEKLARLLFCIKKQSFEDFECLVIDDGSRDETVARYQQVWESLDDRFHLHLKDRNERGGGPGKTRNAGIRLAAGDFIAFCDDDDLWLRDDHLEISVAVLKKCNADMFFANLQLSNETNMVNPSWFAKTVRYLCNSPVNGEDDIFEVTKKDVSHLLVHQNLHVDTLVTETRLITEAGMFYEREIFGEDYDIIFRLVDNARKILFRTTIVANLDVSHRPGFFRSHQVQERLLLSILAALRAESQLADAGLRRVARANRAWYMLELARLLLEDGRRTQTRELAVQSLFVHPSMQALRLLSRAGWRR